MFHFLQRWMNRQSVGTAEPEFRFLEPPFDFNSAKYAAIPPEVTGYYILRVAAARLGWSSFAGKKILDFGCGVRIARTIINLGIDVVFYAGVDVHKESIAWLAENVKDDRFAFISINDLNPYYNPDGEVGDGYDKIEALKDAEFDLFFMYSVITHQSPAQARRIFSLLARMADEGARLYFTAFFDSATETYAEAREQPCAMSTYNLKFLSRILEEEGWEIERVFEHEVFAHQPAILCRRRRD